MSHYSFCNQDVPIHPNDSDYKNDQLLDNVTNTLLCCTNRVIIIKSYKYVHVDAQNIKVDILSGDHWASDDLSYKQLLLSRLHYFKDFHLYKCSTCAQCTNELLT